jgi:hypothetical protein
MFVKNDEPATSCELVIDDIVSLLNLLLLDA